ncbi:MAG: hypothetical protein ACYTGH_01305 [Planctomycetota bacterium]|jgi:hypothetical protein
MNVLGWKCVALFVGLIMVAFAGSVQAADEKPIRLFAEAEDFTPVSGHWKAKPYRDNYFASTFALTFLSRMGYLEAPEQVQPGEDSVAVQKVNLPRDGAFEVLVRYEQPYNFSAEFDIEIHQKGRVVWTQPFGRLDDVKIWGCSGSPEARRVPMTRFFWGATDNIVWQQGKSKASIKKGPAEIRLVARSQMDGKVFRLKARPATSMSVSPMRGQSRLRRRSSPIMGGSIPPTMCTFEIGQGLRFWLKAKLSPI